MDPFDADMPTRMRLMGEADNLLLSGNDRDRQWWRQHRPLPIYRNHPRLGKGGIFLLDHLPRRHVAYPPITVPWTGCEYAGIAGQFLQYPALMGFDLENLQQGSFGTHTHEEGLAFLQAWLFFGLLQEAFGEEAKVMYKWWVEDWDNAEVTSKKMQSPYLTHYLDLIAERLSERQRRVRPPFHHWQAIFETTITVAEAFDNVFATQGSPAGNDSEEPVSLRITRSILMLGQMLATVIMQCYGVEIPQFKDWPDGTLLHRRAVRRQWCPHLTNKLMSLLSMDGIYLLTLMSWSNPVSRFSTLPADGITDRLLLYRRGMDDPAIGLGRHRRCTPQKCLGEKIDEQMYQTEHVHDDCHCEYIGPNVSEVISILDGKEVPVFRVRQQMDEEGVMHASVQVERSSSVPGYVAISHVWADGLGNRANNNLPHCQVVRLARLVRELSGQDDADAVFWIDTFGVPRELEPRKKALAVMNDTYRLSQRVLVVDGGLQNLSCYKHLDAVLDEADVEQAEQIRMSITVELMLRILCCAWTSRLWTLPEGMLGAELHFQFRDGTVELGDLYAQLKMWPFIGTGLPQDLRSAFIRLRPKLRSQPRLGQPPEDPALLHWPSGSLAGRFVSMFSCLEWRDTTWPEDEATCLGIHLGLDMARILSRPDHQRLEALFSQLDDIPADLAFTHGPRIPRRPYRWAPLHLLEHKDHYLCIPAATSTTPMARRTDRGLRLTCNNFQLATLGERTPDAVFLYLVTIPMTIDHNGRASFVRTDIPPEQQESKWGMSLAVTDPRRHSRSWRQSRLHQAMIEGGRAAHDVYLLVGPECFHGPPANFEQGKIALLAKRLTVEHGIIYVEPLDTVVLNKIPDHMSLRPGVGVANRDSDADSDSDSFALWQGIQVQQRTFVVG